MTNQPLTRSAELVFLDGAVQDIEPFLAGLPQVFQVVALDPQLDGMNQIAQALADYAGLAAIHVISHGAPGSLKLGGSVVGLDNLAHYAQELHSLGQALAPGGDLLLYGCDVAEGEAGAEFLDALARQTGVDVAASTNPTGAGGDWVLERHTGDIEAEPLVLSAVAITLANQAPQLTPAGTLDTGFDGDGKLTTAIGVGSDYGYSVAVQADGKILVAGSSYSGSYRDFALVRYNADGSLDTSFSGDGKLSTAIGTRDDDAYSVALQADGRILVAGYSDNGSNDDFALVRYNADGSLDTSFSGDGKLTTAIGTGDDDGFSVAVQADGKILVVGWSYTSGTNSDFALVRYNADGSLDTSFSGDGKLTTAISTGIDYGRSVTLQADGRILLAGDGSGFALARYNGDGTLDTSFSGDGKVTTSIGTFGDYAYGVTVQPDGRILVAGTAYNIPHFDFALARYKADGSLDTSFSGDGKLATDFGSATEDTGYGVALQPDGKILVAGDSDSGGEGDFALARYNADGSLDTSFSGDGKLTTSIGTGSDSGRSVTVQPDGLILVAGSIFGISRGSNADLALARYLPGGILDQTAREDQAYSLAIPANVFTDPDGDPLGYSASRADGSALPAWLAFNAATRTFIGTPSESELGSLEIKVTATDPGGLSASDTFTLTVQNTNDAPGIANPVADQTANEDASFSFTVPASTFSDPDPGDVFTYSASRADGSALPSWLSFNGATRTFTGTPTDAHLGSLDIKLTATDSGGLTSSDSFTLTVANANDAPVLSQGGTLDTGFDGDGKLTTDFGAANDMGWSVAVQSDGKILVAGSTNGNLALARYLSDGRLDTSFDGDGKLSVTTTSYSSFDIAVQPDGNILVAGEDYLYRFNANGSPDTSFSGDGQVYTDAGRPGLALQADGKIVVAGVTTYNNDEYISLARYNADGSADTSIGTSARRAVSYTQDNWYGESVVVQADGKILVGGYSYDDRVPGEWIAGIFLLGRESNKDYTVVRFNANGSLDTSFSGDGWVTTDLGTSDDKAYGIALQPDGGILLAGLSGATRTAVVRYTASGNLDTGFSGDGKLTTDLGVTLTPKNSVAVQPDGKILVAGISGGDFALARYAADGTLDLTFDGDGTLTTDFGASESVRSVALQADVKILVLGDSGGNLALARYHPGGALNQEANAGSSFSFTLPANTFTDPDGDTLTYAATLANGSTLPGWLAFNTATGSFSGTPNQAGSLDIKVTATDPGGLSASETFTLTVTGMASSPVSTAGDDNLQGGAGNDAIDGGSGIDTVVFAGNLSNYSLTRTASGHTVQDRSGTDGTDTLSNIERIEFADMSVNLTVAANAASISASQLQSLEELYVAYFNRVPDADGLSYWIDQIKAGQSLSQIGESFYSAAIQYSSLTGYSAGMSNADFVRIIYQNVLGRSGSSAPPDEDVNYWANNLASGVDTRGSLINTMLGSAHTFKGNATWGWVADLLDNKVAVANDFAVAHGLNYNTPEESISQGMAIAAAVTATGTTAAIELIGLPADFGI